MHKFFQRKNQKKQQLTPKGALCKSFFQNTCKPKGIGGKIMVNMMNSGHSSMAEWGFTHIEIAENNICLDIGCGGGANVKKLLENSHHG